MTYSHSTPEVLQGLQRFASRRRIPVRIFSDNAKELKKAAEVLTQCARQPVVSYPIDPGWGETEWTFSHPRAPHTNGSTEAMVGVAKRAIAKAMPKYNLTDSLLSTVFTYCEDIANRRPLIRTQTDPHDPEVLTPGHFLGAARGPLPETSGPRPKEQIHGKMATSGRNQGQVLSEICQGTTTRIGKATQMVGNQSGAKGGGRGLRTGSQENPIWPLATRQRSLKPMRGEMASSGAP